MGVVKTSYTLASITVLSILRKRRCFASAAIYKYLNYIKMNLIAFFIALCVASGFATRTDVNLIAGTAFVANRMKLHRRSERMHGWWSRSLWSKGTYP